MSLDQITGGESLEMIVFWSIGAFTMTIGALDTWVKSSQPTQYSD